MANCSVLFHGQSLNVLSCEKTDRNGSFTIITDEGDDKDDDISLSIGDIMDDE